MSELSVNAYAPIIQQASNTFHERLYPAAQAYSHSIYRGYEVGSMTLTGDLEYLLDWFDNGLVRDIVALGPDGATAWHGFVQRMTLTVGGLNYSHGVSNMANRVIVEYTRLDATQNPPTETENQSVTKNDAESQAIYGIKARFINGDKATLTGADTLAQTELARLAYPLRSSSLKFIASASPTLKVDCRGYSFMGDWYNYEQIVNSGTDTASNIIAAILAADPNSILDTSTLNMDTLATDTEAYWQSDVAWKIIRNIVDRGAVSGGAGQPWVVGVYDDRKMTLKAAERVDQYGEPVSTNQHGRIFRDIADQTSVLTDENGAKIQPWSMRPDRIVVLSRLNRASYIRKVNFSPPNILTLTGDEDVFTLST